MFDARVALHSTAISPHSAQAMVSKACGCVWGNVTGLTGSTVNNASRDRSAPRRSAVQARQRRFRDRGRLMTSRGSLIRLEAVVPPAHAITPEALLSATHAMQKSGPWRLRSLTATFQADSGRKCFHCFDHVLNGVRRDIRLKDMRRRNEVTTVGAEDSGPSAYLLRDGRGVPVRQEHLLVYAPRRN